MEDGITSVPAIDCVIDHPCLVDKPIHRDSRCGTSCECTLKQDDCRLSSYYIESYRRILQQHHASIVAIIIEPLVQGAAEMVMHPPGFLLGLKDLAVEFNTLLIADEVAVGMGRTGTLFACEHEQVSPDFLVLGKGLTGGYLPMSATLTTNKVWRAFLGDYSQSLSFFHGHTYGGNPLAAAAACATLDVFDQENTLQKLPEKAAYLGALLKPLRDHPHVGDIRQLGLMAAVELSFDKQYKIGYPWTERRAHAVCEVAKRHGVWLRPLGNVIVIMPPLSVEHNQICQIVDAINIGIQETLGRIR